VLKGSGLSNVVELNKSIISIQKIVDNLLLENLNQGRILSGKELKLLFEQQTSIAVEKVNNQSLDLLSNYDRFYEFKTKSRVKPDSLKHYKSLMNALIDFEVDNEVVIKLTDIDTDWLQDFEIYLSEPRKPSSITKGNLNDNTIKKRFKVFKEFWKYLVDRDLASENRHLKNYKIESYSVDAVALNSEELKALLSCNDLDSSEAKARDMFLFSCMTGMRYSDAVTLRKSQISDDFKVRKGAIKTKDHFEVYLNQTAREILERRNYDMKLLSNQKLNEYLKQVCKRLPIFQKTVQLESRQRGVVTLKDLPKWKVISSHTARRTFTDRLSESNTSLQRIMAMTGHKSVGVVDRYLQKRNKVSLNDVTKIDII